MTRGANITTQNNDSLPLLLPLLQQNYSVIILTISQDIHLRCVCIFFFSLYSCFM